MDVLEIAKQRRESVAKELSKLDEFIRLGEELRKGAGNGGTTAASGTAQEQVKPIREFSSNGASAAKPA